MLVSFPEEYKAKLPFRSRGNSSLRKARNRFRGRSNLTRLRESASETTGKKVSIVSPLPNGRASKALSTISRVNVFDSIGPEAFLEVLNRRGIGQSSREDQLRSLQDDTTRRLRKYVDDWIGTAADELGERPFERDICKSTEAKKAVLKRLSRNPPKIVFDEALGLGIRIRDGEYSYLSEWDAADYLISLLICDWSASLGRCPYCRQYFVRKPNRKWYSNRLFCSPAHRRAQAAKTITERRRKSAEAQLLEKAAAVLHRRGIRTWRWLDRDEVKQDVVVKLQGFLTRSRDPDLVAYRKSRTISIRWLTRHQGEIENRRRLGKGSE